MAARLKFVLRILLRNVFKLFFLFPIKNGRILFTVLNGEKIYDNPKCVYDFLAGQDPNRFEFIWVYNGDRKETGLPDSVKVVKRQTLQWVYYMMTANVVVDDWPPSLLIPARKKQLYIETWHAGGAYKKIGKAYAGAQKAYQTKPADIEMRTIKLFVSSSGEFTKSNIEAGYQYGGEILPCGMPRNDVFFHEQALREAADRVKKSYDLSGIAALYAPTFRGMAYDPVKVNALLDLEQTRKALAAKYGEEVNLLVRCHPVDRHQYPFGKNVIDVSDYPDMQDLLCAADLLITDYSSCMWDFALLGRPCFLYTPDIDQYIRDRGFFTPPEQWPGIVCRSMEELCEEIQHFEEAACAAKARRHLERMGSYETGHATETISKRIVDYINGD